MSTLLALALSTVAHAGPFSDAPPDVAVVEVASGPTEQVWTVGAARVRLRKSPGPDELPTVPRCAGSGVDLLVEGTPTAAEDVAIEAACRRLATEAPAFASGRPPSAAPRPDPWARSALRALAVAWLGLLLWALPRRAGAWGWAAAGLAVRLAVPGPRVLMAVAYPYERMLVYAGLKPESALYGAGWPALADVLRPVFGASPDGIHRLHLAASVATVAVAFEAARRLTGDRRAAHAAGALVATLPLAVALARSEEAFVVAALLTVAAVLGLARGDRAGALLAATSAGLLGNVRPDQLPAAAVVSVVLLGRWRPAALLAAVPLVLRAGSIAAAGNPEDLGADDLLRPLLHPFGAESPTVWLDPWRTPCWLLPLGVVGLREAGRRGWPLRGVLAALLVAGWAPYLVFERATDLARFQLPSSTLLAVVAALGAPWVLERRATTRALLLAVGVAGLVVARRPLGGPMVQAVEHELLRDEACVLPPGSVVRYDASVDPHGGAARWLDVRCGVKLRVGAPSPGDHLLVGRGNRSPGGHPPPACTTEVVRQVWTPAYDGHVSALGTAPVEIGLFRVVSCP